MFTIDNQLVDVLRFDKMGIVKARDKTTEETKRYVGIGEGISELADIKQILGLGTKFTGDEIKVMTKRFEPYQNFKHHEYEAEDQAKTSN